MAKRPRQPRPPMSGGGGMMKQLQQLQEQMAVAQESLTNETVSATAGGGVVSATVTGDQQLQAIKLDPAILEDADVEMIQDLILIAVNSALDKSRELAAERLGPLTSGLPF
jgi:nucleoid-associated protein EbfC